jgi:hypothetical protein
MNLAIFLKCTESFCYTELTHFSKVNSTILSDILDIFAYSYCYSELGHFATISVILLDILKKSLSVCYSELNHSIRVNSVSLL